MQIWAKNFRCVINELQIILGEGGLTEFGRRWGWGVFDWIGRSASAAEEVASRRVSAMRSRLLGELP